MEPWSTQASIALTPVLNEYEVGGRRPFTENKDLFIYVFVFST